MPEYLAPVELVASRVGLVVEAASVVIRVVILVVGGLSIIIIEVVKIETVVEVGLSEVQEVKKLP